MMRYGKAKLRVPSFFVLIGKHGLKVYDEVQVPLPVKNLYMVNSVQYVGQKPSTGLNRETDCINKGPFVAFFIGVWWRGTPEKFEISKP